MPKRRKPAPEGDQKNLNEVQERVLAAGFDTASVIAGENATPLPEPPEFVVRLAQAPEHDGPSVTRTVLSLFTSVKLEFANDATLPLPEM